MLSVLASSSCMRYFEHCVFWFLHRFISFTAVFFCFARILSTAAKFAPFPSFIWSFLYFVFAFFLFILLLLCITNVNRLFLKKTQNQHPKRISQSSEIFVGSSTAVEKQITINEQDGNEHTQNRIACIEKKILYTIANTSKYNTNLRKYILYIKISGLYLKHLLRLVFFSIYFSSSSVPLLVLCRQLQLYLFFLISIRFLFLTFFMYIFLEFFGICTGQRKNMVAGIAFPCIKIQMH